ncbi:hypothetical protein ACFWN1_01185 [Streptomyces sp. NPDC058459]|uniref:hypothetical protein n=1 Tax=Streptomyces sp. NPDC058459 TaxID=3346508 RepID=UPI003669E4AE
MLAAAAFTPAVAHAADGGGSHGTGGLTVAPAVPVPGTDVSLRVRGCTASQGTAASSAFVSDARLTGGQGDLSGQTRVRTSLKAGAYDVRITCADHSFTGRISVDEPGAGVRPGSGSGSGDEPDTGPSPVAPVHAGGGGTAAGGSVGADTSTLFATVAPTGSGPGAAQALTGLALAGCTAVTVGALRGRRSRNDG